MSKVDVGRIIDENMELETFSLVCKPKFTLRGNQGKTQAENLSDPKLMDRVYGSRTEANQILFEASHNQSRPQWILMKDKELTIKTEQKRKQRTAKTDQVATRVGRDIYRF